MENSKDVGWTCDSATRRLWYSRVQARLHLSSYHKGCTLDQWEENALLQATRCCTHLPWGARTLILQAPGPTDGALSTGCSSVWLFARHPCASQDSWAFNKHLGCLCQQSNRATHELSASIVLGAVWKAYPFHVCSSSWQDGNVEKKKKKQK